MIYILEHIKCSPKSLFNSFCEANVKIENWILSVWILTKQIQSRYGWQLDSVALAGQLFCH